MAEDKKVFLQGKMNQDIDDRILPTGEYREAQNIQITTSEGSDVGAIQNVSGNELVGAQSIVNSSAYATTALGSETLKPAPTKNIGCFFDEKNSKIYYFLTNYTCPNPNDLGLVGQKNSGPTMAGPNDYCAIWVYNKLTSQSKPLVQGVFLNFSTTHEINGINLLENLLFWTDGLNQPRKINVENASTNLNYYKNEDKISVAKFAPFMAPFLLDYTTTTFNANSPDSATEATSSMTKVNSIPKALEDKFVRFSYRFQFVDGEYSTIAPFTQICFIPKAGNLGSKEQQQIYDKGEVSFTDINGEADGMVNSINKVGLNIVLPAKKIKTEFDISAIEILYKESSNNVVRAIELIDLIDQADTNMFQYDYKSTLPYKTLAQDQLTRVYDNVPLSARAQEIIGNRVVYGNFVQDRKLTANFSKNQGSSALNFSAAVDSKFQNTNFWGNADFNNYFIHKEYPLHSIKQRRTYELGVVLADKFGRQSPVLTSTLGLGSINVPAKDESFFGASWDNVGIISSTSKGNEDYCGDALEITFNEGIQNPYAKGKLINLTESTTVVVDTTENTIRLSISIDGLVTVGDYVKGRDKDFVQIISVDNNIITCDGPPSLDINRSSSDIVRDGNDLTYALYTYKITPHGWYSYRVVVKQTEQEYYNVYTTGAFNYDNGKDEVKSYFTLIGDNINKIVRDKEFSNSQETGLSTSRAQIFPKVVQEGTQTAPTSTVSNAGLLNVISIGTAKEQGLTDFTDNVLAIVTEAEKNPMVVQIPYGSATSEFGQDVDISPTIFSSAVSVKRINQGKSLLINADEVDSDDKYFVGKYLKGQHKDLVKIIKTAVASSKTTLDLDDVVSDLYSSGTATDAQNSNVPFVNSTSAFYKYKYGKQEIFSVFETKPTESALDIFYETSTNGLVHELNEAANFVGGATTLTFIETENFNEGTFFYPEGLEGVDSSFQNIYAASLEVNDIANTTLSSSVLTPVIQAVRFSNIDVTDQDASSLFDLFLDDNDNTWKIKPNANFVHERTVIYQPYTTVNHPTYYFDISIEVNSVTVLFTDIVLELQNVEPVIENGTFHTVESEGQEGILYSVEAVNGSSKGAPENQGGLYYTSSTNIYGEPNSSSFEVETLENFTNLSANLRINNWNGDIKLINPSNFAGSLDEIVTVRVYDSHDYNNASGYQGVNQGNGGGIYAEQQINFRLGNGLIVIEANAFEDGNYQGPYAFEGQAASVVYGEDTHQENFLCGWMKGRQALANPFNGGVAKNWNIDLQNLTNGLPTIRKVHQRCALGIPAGFANLADGYKNLYPFFETNTDNNAFEPNSLNQTVEFNTGGNSLTPRDLSKYGPGQPEASAGTSLGVNFNYSTNLTPPNLDENLEVRGILFGTVNTSKATIGGVIDQNNNFDPQGTTGVLADFSFPRGTQADFSFSNDIELDGWNEAVTVDDVSSEEPYGPDIDPGTNTPFGGYPYIDFEGNTRYLALPHERNNPQGSSSGVGNDGVNGTFLIKTNYIYTSPNGNTQYAVLMDVKKPEAIQSPGFNVQVTSSLEFNTKDELELERVFLARI